MALLRSAGAVASSEAMAADVLCINSSLRYDYFHNESHRLRRQSLLGNAVVAVDRPKNIPCSDPCGLEPADQCSDRTVTAIGSRDKYGASVSFLICLADW